MLIIYLFSMKDISLLSFSTEDRGAPPPSRFTRHKFFKFSNQTSFVTYMGTRKVYILMCVSYCTPDISYYDLL
jgi:hypothetical protein